jgi:integrase/recombinase XerD
VTPHHKDTPMMTINITQITTDFKSYLTQIGYQKNTVQMLPSNLKEFLLYTAKELENINKIDVLEYHKYIKTRPKKRGIGLLSESMVNHHVYALKVFFNYQMELGVITQNPMSTLTFEKPKSKPREILSQQEINELFEICQSHKEKAILSLCYGLGLRRMEVQNLKLADLDFEHLMAYVREGKGKKRRIVPMTQAIANHLKNYIQFERKSKSNVNTVLCSVIGTSMSGNRINSLMKKTVERLELDKNITLHSLRHSVATHLLENGLKLEVVRDFLGHKHLETTQIYTRINMKRLWGL